MTVLLLPFLFDSNVHFISYTWKIKKYISITFEVKTSIAALATYLRKRTADNTADSKEIPAGVVYVFYCSIHFSINVGMKFFTVSHMEIIWKNIQ